MYVCVFFTSILEKNKYLVEKHDDQKLLTKNIISVKKCIRMIRYRGYSIGYALSPNLSFTKQIKDEYYYMHSVSHPTFYI